MLCQARGPSFSRLAHPDERDLGPRLERLGGESEDSKWTLCYSSFTDDTTSPATFHMQCDQYITTMAIAHNSLNCTFGGYVRC